jgi:hypothetical protein
VSPPTNSIGNSDVLDIRPRVDFAAGHLPRAWSCPLEEAPEWPVDGRPDPELLGHLLPSVLLPPRERPFLVVASSLASARTVCALLTARGRPRPRAASLGPDGDASLRALAVERGAGRPRLWQPPPFLMRWVHLLPPGARGPVADFACGSGRAAVWLALRGWRVQALDRDDAALELARLVADREGVALELRRADLRLARDLPTRPVAAAVILRYLERSLLARLPELVLPHGVAVLRTFREVPGGPDAPRTRHRLTRLEWTRLLPPRHWELIVHEEGFDPDGRPAAGAVARRRPD